MPDEKENKEKLDTHTAVGRAKDILNQSDAIAFVILALPEDDKKGEDAYIMGDIESLAPLQLRLQHLLLRMLDATTMNMDDSKQQIGPKEGYT